MPLGICKTTKAYLLAGKYTFLTEDASRGICHLLSDRLMEPDCPINQLPRFITPRPYGLTALCDHHGHGTRVQIGISPRNENKNRREVEQIDLICRPVFDKSHINAPIAFCCGGLMFFFLGIGDTIIQSMAAV